MEKDKTVKLMLGIAIVLLIILIIGVFILIFQKYPDSEGNIVVQLG